MRALPLILSLTLALAFMGVCITDSGARNPIRNDFFDIYTGAEGTQLDDLPSNSGHCGVCHFDFDGGGARNPYGLGIEVGRSNGLSDPDAIMAIDGNDSDGDGYSNNVEITNILNFSNTPTFPGLSQSNVANILNVTVNEVTPYLTPAGATDTTAPTVTITSPGGGEDLAAGSYFAVQFDATDSSGISHVDIHHSGDGGTRFEVVARNQSPGSGFSWFVPNRPGATNIIRVVAYDNAGNTGHGDSGGYFTITATPAGFVPSTLRDMDMTGTQPHHGGILDDPDLSCATCHGNYDSDVEPWFVWRGSMMSQAARDPFFYACMAVAEQDAPSVGDVCIRCHSPGGWQEGRSVDTSGELLNSKDRHGVQCDFCHRSVDFDYQLGVSPVQDEAVLDDIHPLPLQYANGQFITDPSPLMRGPYSDAEASHAFVESPFHRSADICGTCHDVSNPVFDRLTSWDYGPNTFDLEHPDMDLRNMFPIERTYSEWSQSEYAFTGVYAPQFAGDKPDGIVSTCQDCHMRDVTGKGCNESGAPNRSDLPLHDLMGGNTFVVDIVGSFYPDEVDAAQLLAAKNRATEMLQKAATLQITPEDFGVTVRVINETGHKLPSGYPEGRRIWLNVVAYDSLGQKLFESAAYDFATADLTHDDQAKIYEIHPGLSPGLAFAIGLPAGKSFHFVLNDTIYFDNRIPPRGFANAAFEAIQSAPVAYTYADSQYWDDTEYNLPPEADSVHAILYYQTTSKEYVEFLRDENYTNSAGQDLYNAWNAQGKSAPVVMAEIGSPVDVTYTGTGRIEEEPKYTFGMSQNYPNPFNPMTSISYSLPVEGPVKVNVYDASGRLVRSLVNETQLPGRYRIDWDGMNEEGYRAAAGIYFIRYEANGRTATKKSVMLK